MAEILRNAPPYPVVDLGAGDGAITAALLAQGFFVVAVEIDPRMADRLRNRFRGTRAEVVETDLLRYRFVGAQHIVANVPFSLTTPLLRRLLQQDDWHTAVLLVQWEVARKRAAVGGTTLLTATWWPWYEFTLAGRVPARAFRPIPSVDGGILVLRRRASPLVPSAERVPYQRMVNRAFTGPGRGMAAGLSGLVAGAAARRLLRRDGLPERVQARDLSAEHWVALHRLAQNQR